MAAQGLIGRDQELRVLTGLIDQVTDGGAAVVVLGDPGVGKSSLLRAAADHGRAAGHQVLATTGIEAEAHLPFAGLHHLLRPVLSEAGRLARNLLKKPSSGVLRSCRPASWRHLWSARPR